VRGFEWRLARLALLIFRVAGFPVPDAGLRIPRLDLLAGYRRFSYEDCSDTRCSMFK